jgi:hypothetical protein
MLSIFGLEHPNQYQHFIMIPMKIFMVLYVVENILHSIRQRIYIGSIKNSIKKLSMNVTIPHRIPSMKMVLIWKSMRILSLYLMTMKFHGLIMMKIFSKKIFI